MQNSQGLFHDKPLFIKQLRPHLLLCGLINKVIERATNFEDLILPNGITVVDYLEKADNFYTISQDIKNFFDKLKSGICLVCLQKKRDQDFGRGGDFSAEKARLYLSMSPGVLKIVKAKNWVDSANNPNNQKIDFKLVSGIKFLPVSGWKNQE